MSVVPPQGAPQVVAPAAPAQQVGPSQTDLIAMLLAQGGQPEPAADENAARLSLTQAQNPMGVAANALQGVEHGLRNPAQQQAPAAGGWMPVVTKNG